MTKKDVLEIRHLFAPKECSISKIRGCYVDGDCNKVATINEQFLTMPEEETYKYFEILKKTLSGSIGKNLVTMPFPTSQEFEGGTQEFLNKLRKSKLENDELINEFYDKVIENYDYTGNYLILLIHDTYDVPGKTTDGIMMDDASDEVYDYIMCSICHVNLSKAGLSYFDVESTFHNRVRDWVVDMPDIGFLFPAFIDRSTDIHNVLYYTKKPEELHDSFISNILGTSLPITAGEQKDVFQEIVAETLGDDCNYDMVRTIHDNLNEMIEQRKDSPEPLTLSKNTIKNLLTESGVSDEKMADFDAHYEKVTAAASPPEQPSENPEDEPAIVVPRENLLFLQYNSDNYAYHKYDTAHYLKSIWYIRKWHPLRAHIHSIHTGYNCRHSHDDGYGRQKLHGVVQSVVDDGRHELSRTTYDIPVYLCHLDSLLVLHQNIVQQFLILRVLLDPAVSCQLVKNYSIRSQ